MKYSVTKATPRNMRYVLCQVCGFRYHIKDVVKVKDIHNRQYGLIVCRRDLDKPNPQDKPKIVKEEIVKNITIMNPEPEETLYITNANDDRLPGQPSNGFTTSDPFDGSIVLHWSAPYDQGSSPITGYFIQYSIPQRFNYITLTSDTLVNIPYYKDTTNSSTSYVSYKVAAINGYGQGEYSDEFYWPVDLYADIFVYGEQYLITGDLDYITVGSGELIVLSGITS